MYWKYEPQGLSGKDIYCRPKIPGSVNLLKLRAFRPCCCQFYHRSLFVKHLISIILNFTRVQSKYVIQDILEVHVQIIEISKTKTNHFEISLYHICGLRLMTPCVGKAKVGVLVAKLEKQ